MEGQIKEEFNLGQIYRWNIPHTCNYCKKGQVTTWSFTKSKMRPYTYQLMMQRGWRRCGDYYYKNNLAKACCKQWTIRLDTQNFKIKKDQKKTVKKMMGLAYQYKNVMAQDPKQAMSKNKKAEGHKGKIIIQVCEQYKNIMRIQCQHINAILKTQLQQKIVQNKQEQFNFDVTEKLKYFSSQKQAKGDFYCNYVMLLYGMNKKCFEKNYTLIDFVKATKEKIQSIVDNDKYFCTVQHGGYLIFTLKNQKKQSSKQYQIIELQEEGSKKNTEENKKKIQKPSKQSIEPQPVVIKPIYEGSIRITHNRIDFGKLRIDIVPVQESKESFKMYQKYCKFIHEKEKQSMSSYVSFLCTNGLHAQTIQAQNKNEQKYYIPSWDPQEKYQKRSKVQQKQKNMLGCYHMKYYLDGKFIAVGVVDFVPDGLSSVYFFYDPDYKDYRLGVFSAMIEIQYVRYMSLSFPSFKYYHLGFYIQENQKMSYKGDYGPCHLLCPVTYNYIQLTQDLRDKLEKIRTGQIKSQRLAPPQMPKNPDMVFTVDLGVYINQHLRISYNGRRLKLSQINSSFYVPVLQILRQYIQTWGKQLFSMMEFSF